MNNNKLPLVCKVEMLVRHSDVQDDPQYKKIEEAYHELINGQPLPDDLNEVVKNCLDTYLSFIS